MALTQDCKNTYVASFACQINTLSDKYVSSLDRGDACSDNYLFKLEIAVVLNEILCSIDVNEDSCLTNDQICTMVENIKQLLKTKNCGC
jgi:hypothetical protein